MLTEMIESGHKIKEEVKAIQSELKRNIYGTNSEGKETGTQVNNLEQKEEINIQPEQNKETIQKNEERLRNLWDNFKHSNIWSIGMPEGEEEDQEIKNLFEQIMKVNFPNLAKELDMQVQDTWRVPKKLDPRHIIIKLPKIKGEDRILKAARKKERVAYKGVSIKLSSDFSKETL